MNLILSRVLVQWQVESWLNLIGHWVKMKLIKLALFVALCLCCAGLALGLPKKKNKNNNNKVSNSELEDSDLIPIPDHLLDDYNKNSNSGKIQSEILNQVSMNMVGRL